MSALGFSLGLGLGLGGVGAATGGGGGAGATAGVGCGACGLNMLNSSGNSIGSSGFFSSANNNGINNKKRPTCTAVERPNPVTCVCFMAAAPEWTNY